MVRKVHVTKLGVSFINFLFQKNRETGFTLFHGKKKKKKEGIVFLIKIYLVRIIKIYDQCINCSNQFLIK